MAPKPPTRFHSAWKDRDLDDLAIRLMSDERRRYQDPLKISKAFGVRNGMTVADLGCGSGFFTLPLAQLVGARGLVYAVESNPAMLRHLRRNIRESGADGKTIKIKRADVSRTQIPSASVDIVLLARILHDVEDKASLLSEVGRICKPNGRIVDLDWKKLRRKNGPPYEILLSESESKKILVGSGLRFNRTFDAGRYHYGLILNRHDWP